MLIRGEVKEVVEEAMEESQTAEQAKQGEQVSEFMKRILAGDRKAGSDPDQKPGMTTARFVRSLAVTGGDRDKAVAWAKQKWGADDGVVKALMASDHESGGVWIPPEWSMDMIELLRPGSVVRSLNPVIAPMNRGSMSWPKLTGGATAQYTGETRTIQKTEVTTGALQLVAKKLTAILPMSNDLLRYGGSQVDVVVRDDLAATLNERSDLAFIRGTGSAHEPAGLRQWALNAGNITGATASTPAAPTLAEILNEVGGMRLRLRQADVRMIRPGWIMSPRTEQVLRDTKNGDGFFVFRNDMNAGRFEQYPYRVTTQIPENLGGGSDETELYLQDFADVVIGESEGLVIDASNQAAYFDGVNIKAAFSEDTTVIRAIMLHDLGMRHEESVQVVNQLRWTTAP